MYEYNAVVVDVHDGDTFRADIDLGFGVWRHKEIFRMLGINTPELGVPDKVPGIKARDRLRQLILGKQIFIKTVKDQREKYGRYLATIITVEGVNVNDLMIEEGLAVKATY